MNELAPNNLSQDHNPTCSELLGMADMSWLRSLQQSGVVRVGTG